MPSCRKCGAKFKPSPNGRGKFCSRSCSNSYWNSKRPKRKRTARRYTCINCKVFLKKNSQKKYCSSGCQVDYRNKEIIRRWRNREDEGTTKSGCLKTTIRNYLLAKCNHKCPRCEWGEKNPYLDKVILTIEHKDGDAFNNDPDNIEVLCYNCHTLTPTFGILNKGNGTRYTPRMRQNDIQNKVP